MKLIVGLGNYGKQYDKTRHNAGFRVLDAISQEWQVEPVQRKFKALIAIKQIQGESVMLMKPQTYMNASGEAVGEAMRFYRLQPKNLLIIYDDMDLPIGKIRLREKGSAGGQNGMKNIIAHVGTQEFARIRVGIGKNPHMDTIDWVLGKIGKEDWELHMESIGLAKDAAIYSVNHTFADTMNRYNKR